MCLAGCSTPSRAFVKFGIHVLEAAAGRGYEDPSLAKYIGLIEEERAIAFLTRRMASAAWKDGWDISFLTLLHALPHKTVAPTVAGCPQVGF